MTPSRGENEQENRHYQFSRNFARHFFILQLSALHFCVLSAVPAAATPIKHVVIIMQENHAFDNMFGTFPGLTFRFCGKSEHVYAC